MGKSVKSKNSVPPAKPVRRAAEIASMSKKELVKRAKKFSRQYWVGDGDKFSLKEYDTRAKEDPGSEEKPLVKQMLEMGVEALAAMQEVLYADDKWSLLLIFQAMDAAGKDGAIKHVMSGVNPQGCQVTSFKAPSTEDLDHDFLWRCVKQLPERGRIGIFNRSYYEEVLIVRVHENILNAQKLPAESVSKSIWKERYQDIRNFEKYLYRNGTVVIKFFLHVSKDEQKKRFIARIDDPDKNWKFSPTDAKERGYWQEYMDAYEDMIRNTSTKKAPWYVVPADNKPYARIVIASAIIDALDELGLEYPDVSKEKIAELQGVKKQLLEEK
jgi:PPK2 family polyphosphate:nucleotide phosphotransferase